MVFRIREAREAAGMTQNELAARLGINNVTLSGYETGKHDPKSETLVKIAKICNTTTDFLLGREDMKPEVVEFLYISRPSGDESLDELRKQLHDYIDSLSDDELRAMSVMFKIEKN